ncbi:uncharacterized protein LOC129229864 [Uloborus diversus]|uniref:uncharacterized protein LOC129229864 n=1 Tax=Uloborus diversus TaxID=327109 RepID=UPI00240902DE|nr:uncharacterized protein LOC129229864 [Uloborus diversus]
MQFKQKFLNIQEKSFSVWEKFFRWQEKFFSGILISIFFALCLFCVHAQDIVPEPKTAELHQNKPRALRFYSKQSDQHPKETGVGLHRHLENALRGGSIGIDFDINPLKQLKYLFQNRFKKFNIDWSSLIQPKKKQSHSDFVTVKPNDGNEREESGNYWEYVRDKQNTQKDFFNGNRFDP